MMDDDEPAASTPQSATFKRICDTIRDNFQDGRDGGSFPFTALDSLEALCKGSSTEIRNITDTRLLHCIVDGCEVSISCQKLLRRILNRPSKRAFTPLMHVFLNRINMLTTTVPGASSDTQDADRKYAESKIRKFLEAIYSNWSKKAKDAMIKCGYGSLLMQVLRNKCIEGESSHIGMKNLFLLFTDHDTDRALDSFIGSLQTAGFFDWLSVLMSDLRTDFSTCYEDLSKMLTAAARARSRQVRDVMIEKKLFPELLRIYLIHQSNRDQQSSASSSLKHTAAVFVRFLDTASDVSTQACVSSFFTFFLTTQVVLGVSSSETQKYGIELLKEIVSSLENPAVLKNGGMCEYCLSISSNTSRPYPVRILAARMLMVVGSRVPIGDCAVNTVVLGVSHVFRSLVQLSLHDSSGMVYYLLHILGDSALSLVEPITEAIFHAFHLADTINDEAARIVMLHMLGGIDCWSEFKPDYPEEYKDRLRNTTAITRNFIESGAVEVLSSCLPMDFPWRRAPSLLTQAPSVSINRPCNNKMYESACKALLALLCHSERIDLAIADQLLFNLFELSLVSERTSELIVSKIFPRTGDNKFPLLRRALSYYRRFSKCGRNTYWELLTLAKMINDFDLDFRPYIAETVKILNEFPEDPIIHPLREELNKKLMTFRGGQSIDSRVLNTFSEDEVSPGITDDVIDLLATIVFGNDELYSTILRENLSMVLSRVMRVMTGSRDPDLLIKSMETVIVLMEYINVRDSGLLGHVLQLLTAENDARVRLVAAETLRILISEYNVNMLLSIAYNLIHSCGPEKGCLLLRLMQTTPEYDCWQTDSAEGAKEIICLLANSFNSLVNSALDRQHSLFSSRAPVLNAMIEACAALASSGGRCSSTSFSWWCKIEEDLLRLVLTPALPWNIWLCSALTLRTLLSISLAFSDYNSRLPQRKNLCRQAYQLLSSRFVTMAPADTLFENPLPVKRMALWVPHYCYGIASRLILLCPPLHLKDLDTRSWKRIPKSLLIIHLVQASLLENPEKEWEPILRKNFEGFISAYLDEIRNGGCNENFMSMAATIQISTANPEKFSYLLKNTEFHSQQIKVFKEWPMKSILEKMVSSLVKMLSFMPEQFPATPDDRNASVSLMGFLTATLEMVGLSEDALVLTSMECLHDLLAQSDGITLVASPEFIDIFIDLIRHYSLSETFNYKNSCSDLIKYLVNVTDRIINVQPALWEYIKSDFRKLKVIFDFSCELLKRPWNKAMYRSGLLNVILECLKGAPEEDQEQLRVRIQEKEDWISNIEKIKVQNDVDADVRRAADNLLAVVHGGVMVIRLLRGKINAGNIEPLLIRAHDKKTTMASLSVFRKCCEQGQMAVNELWINGALSCILQNLSKDPTNGGDYAEDILNASLACLHSFIEHDQSSRSWWTLAEDKLESIVRNCLWPFQSKNREGAGHKESALICEFAITILWSLVEKSEWNEQTCGQSSAVDMDTDNVLALELLLFALADNRIHVHRCLPNMGATIKNTSNAEVKIIGLRLFEKLFCYYHTIFTGSGTLAATGQLDEELLYFIEFGYSLLQEYIDGRNDYKFVIHILRLIASIFNGFHCKAASLLTPVATFRKEIPNGPSTSSSSYIQSVVPWEITRSVTNGLTARIRMNPSNRAAKPLSSFFTCLAEKHRETCCMDRLIKVLKKFVQLIARTDCEGLGPFEDPVLKIVGRVCELARIANLGFSEAGDDSVVESLIFLMRLCMENIHKQPFDVKYEAVHALFSLLVVGRSRDMADHENPLLGELVIKLCQEEDDIHVQGLLIRIIHLLRIAFHDDDSSALFSLVNSLLEVFLNNSKPAINLDVALIMDASVAVMQYRQDDEGFVFQLMGKNLLEGILRVVLALPQCSLRTDIIGAFTFIFDHASVRQKAAKQLVKSIEDETDDSETAQASTDILTRFMSYGARYVRNILFHVKSLSVIQRMIRVQRKHKLDPTWTHFSQLLETVADIHGHGHAYWAKVYDTLSEITERVPSSFIEQPAELSFSEDLIPCTCLDLSLLVDKSSEKTEKILWDIFVAKIPDLQFSDTPNVRLASSICALPYMAVTPETLSLVCPLLTRYLESKDPLVNSSSLYAIYLYLKRQAFNLRSSKVFVAHDLFSKLLNLISTLDLSCDLETNKPLLKKVLLIIEICAQLDGKDRPGHDDLNRFTVGCLKALWRCTAATNIHKIADKWRQFVPAQLKESQKERPFESMMQRLQMSMIEYLEELGSDQKLECIFSFINIHWDQKRNSASAVRLIPKLIDALDISKWSSSVRLAAMETLSYLLLGRCTSDKDDEGEESNASDVKNLIPTVEMLIRLAIVWKDGCEEEKRKSLELMVVFGMKSCERIYRHMKFLVNPAAFTALLKDKKPYIRKCTVKAVVNMSRLDYYSNWETIFSSQDCKGFTMCISSNDSSKRPKHSVDAEQNSKFYTNRFFVKLGLVLTVLMDKGLIDIVDILKLQQVSRGFREVAKIPIQWSFRPQIGRQSKDKGNVEHFKNLKYETLEGFIVRNGPHLLNSIDLSGGLEEPARNGNGFEGFQDAYETARKLIYMCPCLREVTLKVRIGSSRDRNSTSVLKKVADAIRRAKGYPGRRSTSIVLILESAGLQMGMEGNGRQLLQSQYDDVFSCIGPYVRRIRLTATLMNGVKFHRRQSGNQPDANNTNNQNIAVVIGKLLLNHVLPNFTGLAEIDFSGAKLGDKKMSEILDAWQKTIATCKTLKLAKNALRDSFIGSLKLILSHNPCNIQRIDLSGNQLSEAVIADLVSCRKSYGRLESIDLRDNGKIYQLRTNQERMRVYLPISILT